MAASEKTGAPDLSRYFDDKDPVISDHARDILTNYSGIPAEQLVPHVRAVRDRAWQLFRYPCIGNYSFLDFGISKAEQYPAILERVRSGQTLLDLACCLGQDIRRLIFDGAPAANVAGSELEQGFLDLGFELFRDRSRLGANLSSGDFFSDDVAGLKGRTFDVIHAGSFFHLFSWDEQVQAMTRAIGLLKPKAGSVLFGRQTAVSEAVDLKHAESRSGSMYRHDIASFRKLIGEVGRKTGKKLEVSIEPAKEREEMIARIGWYRVSFYIVLQD